MGPDNRRLEELGLNSSAPPGQLVYDGWLVRLAPGKAKRARSVNAVYASTLPVAQKIDYCERLYRRARLPAIFRITPLSQPASLESDLERRGYGRFDETAVEAASIDAAGIGARGAEPLPLSDWLDAISALRGAPATQREAHRARLEGMPLQLLPVGVREDGRVVATGLAIVEDDCVGLFDILTDAAVRGHGHGRAIVAALLRGAWEAGARHAYLQVVADNASARRLYRGFGFSERYRYWYRGRPGEQG